jgi:subtilisin family serine protease
LHAKVPAGGAAAADKEVRVFVTYSGSASALDDSPLRVGHFDGSVATGWIRLSDVERLLTLEGVSRVDLAARISSTIDRSMADIKVDAIRSKAPPYRSKAGTKGYTGEGVLVGVIDDAIVEVHPTFLVPGVLPRKTRIIALWDQSDRFYKRDPNERPKYEAFRLCKYGRLWDEDSINGVLKYAGNINVIKVASQFDHGTHVTGIAAGNGALSDGPLPLYTLVGGAPMADIAFCNAANFDATSAAASDALNFIFALAHNRNQPCVINMSFGSHEGARDGSSNLEQAIERALVQRDGSPWPGRAVVVAAGNEANMSRHSRKLIYARGHQTFRFTIQDFKFPKGRQSRPKLADDTINYYDRLYIWYDAAASLDLRVIPPSGKPDPLEWVTFGGISVSPRVAVASGAPAVANGKKYIVVTLWAPMEYGNWRVEMRETAGADTPIDMWVERMGDLLTYPRFIRQDNVIDNTLTCPATAPSAIAVGAYVCTPGPGERYGQLWDASSRGLDSAYQVGPDQTRPHLVAPGRRIVSANNTSYIDEEDKQDILSLRYGAGLKYHALFSGTSQAAPHVTGVIALMFQKNSQLTAAEIRAILTKTANRANIPIPVFPNRDWGYGRIDADAALAAVPIVK